MAFNFEREGILKKQARKMAIAELATKIFIANESMEQWTSLADTDRSFSTCLKKAEVIVDSIRAFKEDL
jgi:hypothetical protein